MNGAKESEKPKFVSNEQVFEAVTKLTEIVEDIQKEIKAIKSVTGFNDKPVGMPEKRNYNSDPGPWQKKPSA